MAAGDVIVPHAVAGEADLHGGNIGSELLSEVVRPYVERLCYKAASCVSQRPLLAEDVATGLIAVIARRSTTCRAFLLRAASGAASAAAPGSAADVSDPISTTGSGFSPPTDCADVCLLSLSETYLVHYSKRPKLRSPKSPLVPTATQPEKSTVASASSPFIGDGGTINTRDAPCDKTETAIDDKYWKRRYNYFSRFDEGVRMDAGAWFEVTPESVARHIADRMQYGLVVDGTCGVGGNAIQFALTSERVIGVDVDQQRLMDARHNAGLYGVSDRIDFVCDDFVRFAANYSGPQVDAVFLSPPWGGPSHLDAEYFSLKDVACPDIVGLFSAAASISSRVVLYLPRHSDLHEIVILAAAHGYTSVEVEKVLFKYPTPHLKLVIVHFTPEVASCGDATAVRHKSVGADARGGHQKAPSTGQRKDSDTVAGSAFDDKAEASCCLGRDNRSFPDCLLRLPPLAGPLIRALHCRYHYIGRYIVALAFALECQHAGCISSGVIGATATNRSVAGTKNEHKLRRHTHHSPPSLVQATSRSPPMHKAIAAAICKSFVCSNPADGHRDRVHEREVVDLMIDLLHEFPLSHVLRMTERAESVRQAATLTHRPAPAIPVDGRATDASWSSCIFEMTRREHPNIYGRLLARKKAAALSATASAS
eukprot:TRINITY_DN39869_c0_g1_i1.p1 TRINITY_DN39869_c0_g1~~TRINITY_DN39869_c0_g1_i1.p1  ORF type:complete len:676 (-),score=85.50 TRINITY_DN39869_c0_g1_i1:327-2282(-)